MWKETKESFKEKVNVTLLLMGQYLNEKHQLILYP